MGYFAVPFSVVLGIVIIMVELLRNRKKAQVDFISGVNIIYFICFCIVPIFLLAENISNLGDWNWILTVNFDSTAFLLAAAVAIIGYTYILMGYYSSLFISGRANMRSVPIGNETGEMDCSYSRLLLLGHILFFISLACLIIYIRSIGGFWISLMYASAFRGDMPPIVTKWSFLKNIIPLMKFASFFYYGAIKKAGGTAAKIYAKSMFAVSFAITVYVLFHKAGRRNLAFYLFVFLLASMIQKNRISKKAIAAFMLIAAFVTLFGDTLFYIFLKNEALYDSISSFDAGAPGILKQVLLEFSFPFVTLANAITDLNTSISMRFFSDIPLGFAYMLPQKLLNIELPGTISEYNTLRFKASGTIPVDLISFGYYSLGIAGVMLVCYLFGWSLLQIKRKFGGTADPITAVFKAEWIISMAFMVMYGDPDMVIKSNFSLFAATILLFCGLRKGKKDESNYGKSYKSPVRGSPS